MAVCGSGRAFAELRGGVDLAGALAQISAPQWLTAAGFTAVSFWAVGQYDAVLHRHFATGIPAPLARRAGVSAIAVSQTLGFGLISGALLRWHMLPGVSLWQATRLTAAVAASFLAGWAVVTAGVLLILPQAPFKPAALAVLAGAGLLAALSLVAPQRRFRWPNGLTLSRLLALCAVDSLAAALAFHALCPGEIGLQPLLPAFLLALGAGLISGTPGGMGAFEVTLISLLPGADHPGVYAAVLAWRMVYYAGPALLGAGLALLPAKVNARADPSLPLLPKGHRAEIGLRHQGQLRLERIGTSSWLAGRSGHFLVGLLAPLGAANATALGQSLQDLSCQAQAENRLPLVYKAPARLAAQARRQGLTLRRIGWEAVLHPATYRLAASCRAGLRRKLRRAEAAGVSVHFCPTDAVPWACLDRIAAGWVRQHGAERGFSMGRFERAYLSRQRLYIAWASDRPVAFASFHTAPQEWALDLMRHGADLPDGTMHSLIQKALEDAAAAGVARLSLAAIADGAVTRGDLASRLIGCLAPETTAPGLYRFKSTFAPQWRPLYLIAPSRAALVLGGVALWRAITRPAPIMPEIERDDADYAFASAPAAWHIGSM